MKSLCPTLFAFLIVAGLHFSGTSALARPVSTPVVLTPSSHIPMSVYGGSLTLKVNNFVDARQEIMEIITQVGAEIIGGRTFVSEKGGKHGYLHIRLATEQLPQLLPRLRTMGILSSDSISTTDQISDYESLGRRVEQLRKQETRLDALLHTGRNLRGSDILFVQERLFRASMDEESLLQQRLDMERGARIAQMTVTIFEPAPIHKTVPPLVVAQNSFVHWFFNGKRRAEWHRDRLLAQLATVAAFALVYAPLWVPLFIGILLLFRFVWLRRQVIRHTILSLAKLAYSLLRQIIKSCRRFKLPENSTG